MSKRITLPAQALYVPSSEIEPFRTRFGCDPAEFSTITINIVDEAAKVIRDTVTDTMSIAIPDTVICTRPGVDEGRFDLFASSDLISGGLWRFDIKPHKGVSVNAVGIGISRIANRGKLTPILVIHTDGRTWKDWWLRYQIPMLPVFQASNPSIRYVINQ